ncbi:MAG: ABC transporter ATP-binding protein [Candidatus Planktophila sp.]|jgi:general nucleoside transport system ATP-binding protein|tara:strand:- start:17362 stop:18873 length:1512 start_codon:yes stop_codon:yes gene_type:complete
MSTIIDVQGIEKKYPGVIANYDVNLKIESGEIHAIIGENGAGKSTLMKILYGLVAPDSGRVLINGKKVSFKSPQDAMELGVGMVHQHFMLADNATVLENVILGSEPTSTGGVIQFEAARIKLLEIAEKYGLNVRPDQLVSELGIGERQRVEIAKVLYKGAKILILDEPTAVLVPQEVKALFENLKELTSHGLTIIFISHKLDEVLAMANSITVMRSGTTVASVEPKNTNKGELAKLMVGGELPKRGDTSTKPSDEPVLSLSHVSCLAPDQREILSDVSLTVHKGEILGIAGVAGNGQSELIETIMGLIKIDSGTITILNVDISALTSREIRDSGVGYIPQDRQRDGLLMMAPLWENRILGHQSTPPISNGFWVNKSAAKIDSERIVKELDVRTPSINVMAAALSGGNQQKFIVGREMSGDPNLLIASQPTRGVDVGAQSLIWNKLIEARLSGMAILLISSDLDELFNLSDRLAVISKGKIVAVLDPETTTPEQLGLAMTGEKI